MNSILSDASKFERFDKNTDVFKLSLKFEDKVTRFLRQLRDNGIINVSQYNSFHNSGSGPGVMYGLPKIHKNNVPQILLHVVIHIFFDHVDILPWLLMQIQFVN